MLYQKQSKVNYFYTTYIVDYLTEISLYIGGWAAILTANLVPELAVVATAAGSFDLNLHRVAECCGIVLPVASFIVGLLKKRKK